MLSSVTPTNAITELGGTITYAILSGNSNSVMVDTNTGVITTLKVGTTTITATLKGVDNHFDSTTTYLVIISSATSLISVDTATATYVASGTFSANVIVLLLLMLLLIGGTITYAILSGSIAGTATSSYRIYTPLQEQ